MDQFHTRKWPPARGDYNRAMRKQVFALVGLLCLGVIAGLPRHGLSAQPARPLDVEYREVAGRLIGAAMVDRGGYDKLGYLTARIGNRLSGSFGLERAVAWVAEQMKADGLENVRMQPVKVNEHYFDWHHTNADTFDKIDLQDFRKCVASLAVLAYVLADMPGRL